MSRFIEIHMPAGSGEFAGRDLSIHQTVAPKTRWPTDTTGNRPLGNIETLKASILLFTGWRQIRQRQLRLKPASPSNSHPDYGGRGGNGPGWTCGAVPARRTGGSRTVSRAVVVCPDFRRRRVFRRRHGSRRSTRRLHALSRGFPPRERSAAAPRPGLGQSLPLRPAAPMAEIGTESVASALDTKDPLAREGLAVVPKDIAGARFVSQGDTRILERVAA